MPAVTDRHRRPRRTEPGLCAGLLQVERVQLAAVGSRTGAVASELLLIAGTGPSGNVPGGVHYVTRRERPGRNRSAADHRALPSAARTLSTLSHVDYEDVFLVETGPAQDRTGEQWARAILEGAPTSTRNTLSRDGLLSAGGCKCRTAGMVPRWVDRGSPTRSRSSNLWPEPDGVPRSARIATT